jgi:hypothetical protein
MFNPFFPYDLEVFGILQGVSRPMWNWSACDLPTNKKKKKLWTSQESYLDDLGNYHHAGNGMNMPTVLSHVCIFNRNLHNPNNHLPNYVVTSTDTRNCIHDYIKQK